MEPAPTIFGFPTETVNAFTGLATAIAAVIAAGFAAKGISAWREEMKGRRAAELAEDVLADFYQARDIYVRVRSPFGFVGEADERKRQDTEGAEIASQLDAYFVPISRLNQERTFLAAFYAKRHRFKAVFGEAAAEPFLTLRSIDINIRSAANVLSQIALARGQINEKLEAVLNEHAQDDEINKQLNAAIEAIESTCRPAIEARAR